MIGEKRNRAPRSGRAGVAALVVLVATAGCGRNQGSLPPGFAPDGSPGADNVLLVDVDSARVDSVTVAPFVRVRIFDDTHADGYRVYRQVLGDTPFDEVVNYVAAFKGAFNRGYELYQVIDRAPRLDGAAEYLGRATVLGVESRAAPLTNVATVPPGDLASLVPRDFQMLSPIDTLETDSLPRMEWEAVPGAVRYFLSIERADRRSFLWVLTPPDGSASYQVGGGTGLRIQDRPLTPSAFFWTVEAIDDKGRVIGRTRSRQIFQVKSDRPES